MTTSLFSRALAGAVATGLLLAPSARADDPNALPLAPLVQAPVSTKLDAPDPRDHWGVVSATTDAPGHDVLSVEFGFPGVSFGYTHGMTDSTDWGVRVDLDYGVLYTTQTQFGMAARVPLRMVLARKDKITLLVHADPGFFTYAGSSGGPVDPGKPSLLGLVIPVGAAVGFAPIDDLRVSFGIDLPMAVQFLHGADFYIGPQFGFTAETFVDKQVSVGINLRFGPMFIPTESSDAQLGFVAQATLGYRL